MTTTLATEIVIHRPRGVLRNRNVPVQIKTSPRNLTTITIGSWSDERVEVVLTEAERISLVEALTETVGRTT